MHKWTIYKNIWSPVKNRWHMMQQTETHHVTGQLNNMQIERQQQIALRGVICPVESATASPRASTHGHWASMKPFGLLPPIPNLQTRWWTALLWECLASTLNKWTEISFTHSDFANAPVWQRCVILFRRLLIPLDMPLMLNKKKSIPIRASL